MGWTYLLIQGKSALDDTVGVLHSRLQSLVARFLHRFPHLRLVHPQKTCCSCRHGPLGLPQRASSPCIHAAESRHALASELYAKSVLPLSLSLSLSLSFALQTLNPREGRVPSRRWTCSRQDRTLNRRSQGPFIRYGSYLRAVSKRGHNSTQGLFWGFGDETSFFPSAHKINIFLP